MGGAVTILAACRIPEVSAAVVFYGLPPETAFKPSDIKVPLEGHYANIDDHITPQKVDAFEAALKSAKRKFKFYRYEADHGFMNEQRDVHERKAAELGWKRMLAFWKKARFENKSLLPRGEKENVIHSGQGSTSLTSTVAISPFGLKWMVSTPCRVTFLPEDFVVA